MQKVSYMGDGVNTEFTFNFPYFENSNVVVTKNGVSATGYNIIGNSGGLDADYPFVGGTVVFDVAPTALDSITIARNLPLSRVVDYQQTSILKPKELNQDANYLMEVIKDRKDELDDLYTQYSEIADKESTATILARITEIHNEIIAVSAQITALGDISTLRQSVTDNSSAITNLQGSVNNIIQNPVYTVPDYAGNPIALSTTANTWIDISQDGVIHISFVTTNAISWMTVGIGAGEDSYKTFTTQVNCDARGADVIYNVKKDQKIKLMPYNVTINTCEIIPFC